MTEPSNVHSQLFFFNEVWSVSDIFVPPSLLSPVPPCNPQVKLSVFGVAALTESPLVFPRRWSLEDLAVGDIMQGVEHSGLVAGAYRLPAATGPLLRLGTGSGAG